MPKIESDHCKTEQYLRHAILKGWN